MPEILLFKDLMDILWFVYHYLGRIDTQNHLCINSGSQKRLDRLLPLQQLPDCLEELAVQNQRDGFGDLHPHTVESSMSARARP